MSLRSRTLRARLLRLSRRTMRLTIRPERDGKRAIASRMHFSQLIWRRTRVLRLPREKGLALHRHESHFLIRPDIRVSLQMHLDAARAARPVVGTWPGWVRHRRPDVSLANPARLHRSSLPQPMSSGPRIPRPLVETSAHAVSLARGLVARLLTSWPARAVDEATVTCRAATGPRAAILQLPAVPPRMRGGFLESRSERQRPLRRGSAFLRGLTLYHFADREVRAARTGGFRSSAFLPAARLRQPEVAAGVVPGNPLTWREVAPVTLHYAGPRAAAPAVQSEHTAAAAAPIVSHPARPAVQSARAAAAPVLDRAATDRLADEVIRRIERRVRIERERRGI